MCKTDNQFTRLIKKIILILISSISFAQSKEHYIAFSVGVDVKDLIDGSDVLNNKNVLDLLLQASLVSKNIEVNIGYETFQQLQFNKYTIGVGYHFPLYGYIKGNEIRTILIPSIEPTLINRFGTWGGGLSHNEPSSHLSIGVNLSFRIHISDSVAIEYLFNALPRTDLAAKYPKEIWKERIQITDTPISINNFIKIIYKINRD